MKWLRHWLEIIAGSCLAVVVVVTFLQVLFRFVLKIPTPWTEEVTRFAFAYMPLSAPCSARNITVI